MPVATALAAWLASSDAVGTGGLRHSLPFARPRGLLLLEDLDLAAILGPSEIRSIQNPLPCQLFRETFEAIESFCSAVCFHFHLVIIRGARKGLCLALTLSLALLLEAYPVRQLLDDGWSKCQPTSEKLHSTLLNISLTADDIKIPSEEEVLGLVKAPSELDESNGRFANCLVHPAMPHCFFLL